jgi:hypothetical protein
MAVPTFRAFLDEAARLSAYESDTVVLYHAIRERQAKGDGNEWSRDP